MTVVGAGLHPARAALPGLDVLGLPQADRHPAHPGAGRAADVTRGASTDEALRPPAPPRGPGRAQAGCRPGRRRACCQGVATIGHGLRGHRRSSWPSSTASRCGRPARAGSRRSSPCGPALAWTVRARRGLGRGRGEPSALRERLLGRWLAAPTRTRRPDPSRAVDPGAAGRRAASSRTPPATSPPWSPAAVVPPLAIAHPGRGRLAQRPHRRADPAPAARLRRPHRGQPPASRRERRWRALAALSGHFLDVMRGLPTLVGYGRARAPGRDDRRGQPAAPPGHDGDAAAGLPRSAALELLATISVAIVAVTVGLRLAHGSMALGTALARDPAGPGGLLADPPGRRRVPRRRRRRRGARRHPGHLSAPTSTARAVGTHAAAPARATHRSRPCALTARRLHLPAGRRPGARRRRPERRARPHRGHRPVRRGQVDPARGRSPACARPGRARCRARRPTSWPSGRSSPPTPCATTSSLGNGAGDRRHVGGAARRRPRRLRRRAARRASTPARRRRLRPVGRAARPPRAGPGRALDRHRVLLSTSRPPTSTPTSVDLAHEAIAQPRRAAHASSP